MKISVIMQSYLGDYPGARKYPEFKFVRAVKSFLNQDYDNKELVIVSDGCKITDEIYHQHYKDNPNIKYCYIDSKDKKTYQDDETTIYYSGTPRGVGVFLASGEIITYLDSDDIILKNRLSTIASYANKNPNEYVWISENAYVNYDVMKDTIRNEEKLKNTLNYYRINGLSIILNEKECGLSGEFFAVTFESSGTFSIIHKKSCDATWRNVVREKNGPIISEDSDFKGQLKKYNQIKIKETEYVICHMLNICDI